MSFFTGKASKSKNTNNNLVTGTETPVMQQGVNAVQNLSSLLQGTGDTAAAQKNYNNYLQNAGYSTALTNMTRGVTGQGAASGLLQSGATSKALVNYGGQLDQQYFNNYLQNLSGLAGIGQQAAGTIGNVGQVSTGATPGLLSSVGQLGSGLGSFASSPLGTKLFG